MLAVSHDILPNIKRRWYFQVPTTDSLYLPNDGLIPFQVSNSLSNYPA